VRDLPSDHWLLELDENDGVAQNILQVVPSAAQGTRHHETAQHLQQTVQNELTEKHFKLLND